MSRSVPGQVKVKTKTVKLKIRPVFGQGHVKVRSRSTQGQVSAKVDPAQLKVR